MGPGAIVAAVIALMLGSAVQSVAGFGMNLLAVPVLLLVGANDLVPAALLVVLVFQSLGMAVRDRGHPDTRLLTWFLPVRLVGTAVGAFLSSHLSSDATVILICSLVLVAVAMSVRGWRVRPTPISWMATGFASGFSNVLSSIGGPPLALAMVDHSPKAQRATQGWSGMVGSIMSLSLLAAAGNLDGHGMAWGFALIPAIVIGSTLGGFARARLTTAESLRPVVWTVAVVGSIAAMARTLL